MPAINKNSTPWLLVVSSMILLFIFVGYWNVSTYLREKQQLAEDVEVQLQLAYSETKDFELVHFIKSQLNSKDDGEGFPDSISIFLDDNPVFPSVKKFELNLDGDIEDPDTTIIFNLEYTTTDDSLLSKKLKGREVTVLSSNKLNNSFFDDKKNKGKDSTKFNFLGKELKTNSPLENAKTRFFSKPDSNFTTSWNRFGDSFPSKNNTFFGNNKDSLTRPLRFEGLSLNQSNTSVNKTYVLFNEKLVSNNLPHIFDIVKDPSTETSGLRVTYKSNSFGFTDWIIDLHNYQLFLIKKMIPTILFSLFLLGIISLAFWTLLRNWIKQNRLVIVKNEFINNMTHELKTPIATIGVALEAISNFDLSKDQDKTKEYLDISRSEVSRLSILVDKVLNVASFDSNKSALKSETVDLVMVVEETVSSMKLQFEDRNATVEFQNNAKGAFIKGDKLHLVNVFHNIIDNALKYSPSNPKIEIGLSEKQNNLMLTIKDNGKGIPKEYQNKIFDRFFRVPTEDRHDVKGHGLGLNYVQNVIQQHAGKIEVKSIENQGTTFIISFPKTVANV